MENKIGIIGLGYVGLPLMVEMLKHYEVVGLDLDYTLGYADGSDKPYYIPNIGNVGHWRYVFKDFLIDDMRILRESAELKGSEIINLNKEAWYDEFRKGDIIE